MNRPSTPVLNVFRSCQNAYSPVNHTDVAEYCTKSSTGSRGGSVTINMIQIYWRMLYKRYLDCGSACSTWTVNIVQALKLPLRPPRCRRASSESLQITMELIEEDRAEVSPGRLANRVPLTAIRLCHLTPLKSFRRALPMGSVSSLRCCQWRN